MKEETNKVLKRLESMSERNFLPSIGPIKGKIISDVIQDYGPKNILEIGTLHGYSSILMGALLPDDNTGKVITIEKDKENVKIARKNIEDAALTNRVNVLSGSALEIVPKLHENFDMVFLDATKEEYLKYLKLVEKNLKKNAVVVADNVSIFEKSMSDYLEYVRNSGRYKSRTIQTELEFNEGVKDAIEVSIKII
ncbi:MAG TPA: class I SAM-dependent methyltransferase [Candidatus Bathyarchaeia archaeon]|nr:class I SAM-dependent methyltransferase [Candidatus Bathyarchaeia archaeon]